MAQVNWQQFHQYRTRDEKKEVLHNKDSTIRTTQLVYCITGPILLIKSCREKNGTCGKAGTISHLGVDLFR